MKKMIEVILWLFKTKPAPRNGAGASFGNELLHHAYSTFCHVCWCTRELDCRCDVINGNLPGNNKLLPWGISLMVRDNISPIPSKDIKGFHWLGLAWWSFGGLLFLGRFHRVSNAFHFQMMDLN